MKDNGWEDQLRGKGNELKGNMKKMAGEAIDDKSLKAEGEMDKLQGNIQQKMGELKDHFSDTEESL